MIIWDSFKLQNSDTTINFTIDNDTLYIHAPIRVDRIDNVTTFTDNIRLYQDKGIGARNSNSALWFKANSIDTGETAFNFWGTVNIGGGNIRPTLTCNGPVNFYQPATFNAAVTLNSTATFNGTASFANDVIFTKSVNLPSGSTIDGGEPWADVPHLLPREQSAYILILGNKKDNDGTLIPVGFPVGMRDIYCQIQSRVNGTNVTRVLRITRPASSEEHLRYQFDGIYNKQPNDGPLARFLNMAYNLDWIYNDGTLGDATIQIFEHYDIDTHTCSDALTEVAYIQYNRKNHYVVAVVPVPLLSESEELPSHINGQIIYEKTDDKLWVQLLPLYYIEECIENWYWWWGYAYTNRYHYMYAPMAYTNYERMSNNTDSTLNYKLMPRYIPLDGNYSPGKSGYDDGPLYLEPLGPILFWH